MFVTILSFKDPISFHHLDFMHTYTQNLSNEPMKHIKTCILYENKSLFLLIHFNFHQLAFHSLIERFLCLYLTVICARGLRTYSTDMYVKDIQTGICAKDGEPAVEKESAATALVDGKNLLGPVVGNFCMNLAIKKAKEVGIGWVVAHGESRFLLTSKEKFKTLRLIWLFKY